jgi:hypothetical protein
MGKDAKPRGGPEVRRTPASDPSIGFEKPILGFKEAGRLLGEAADFLRGLGAPFDEIKKRGFKDASALVRALGERFPDPAFQKMLVESLKRHDRKHGAKPSEPIL